MAWANYPLRDLPVKSGYGGGPKNRGPWTSSKPRWYPEWWSLAAWRQGVAGWTRIVPPIGWRQWTLYGVGNERIGEE